MGTVLKDAEGVFKFIGQVFVDIINALWTTDKQMIMTDATQLLHDEGVALQNKTPGISTEAFIAQLVAIAAADLGPDFVALGIADYHIIAGTIATDLNIPDAGGNAGTVQSSTSTT